MADGFLPNDIISVVTKIISPYLKYLRRYVGEVKSVSDDGEIQIHSLEYGTYSDDPTTWVVALPANRLKNAINPEVGDTIEFYFRDGTADTPRWTYVDAVDATGSKTDDVIYENGDISIKYDSSADELVIDFSDSSIKVTSNKITIGVGSSTIELSSSKIDIDSSIINLNGKPWDTHTHTVISIGAPTSPPL